MMPYVYAALFGESAEELRQSALRWHLEPFARLVFARVPEARSVVYAVAQYYNDEATDGTHHELVLVDHRDPTWPECLSYTTNKLVGFSLPYSIDDLSEEDRQWAIEDGQADAADPDRYAEYNNPEPVRSARQEAERLLGVHSSLDDNRSFARAFAEFCVENANQGMSVAEAYRPYAIARRDDDGRVSIETVGRSRTGAPARAYEPTQRVDGAFELAFPSRSELAQRLWGLVEAQRAAHRAMRLTALVEAMRAADALDEQGPRDANDPAYRALARALEAARSAASE